MHYPHPNPIPRPSTSTPGAVVAGWSGPLGDLLAGLTGFAVPGSEVFIVSSERPPDFPGEGDVWEVEGRSLRYIHGSILEVRKGPCLQSQWRTVQQGGVWPACRA